MNAQVPILQTKLDALWAEWLAAKDKAMASNNIEDGIASGRAFWRFYAALGPEGKAGDVVHGANVMSLRK
jgi:hypothetical protein